jgi:two-component system phosphate regulon sensor histidine kinase PhoR
VSESDRAASNDRDRHERQLQQANDFHGVLLAMAGHDLRKPLQSIVAAYDWLARRLGSSSEQEYLRRGRLAIAQLTDQLDLLIEALRMHEHSVDIQPTPVVLGPILVRLCRESKDIAEHEDLTLHANPTRAVAMSDAVLLQGILRNLIRNAVKYTGPGGRVVVGCRRRGTLLKIEVHDNGIGIPPDKLSEIFEAFRRLDSTRADGLGLGLFVVRRAVGGRTTSRPNSSYFRKPKRFDSAAPRPCLIVAAGSARWRERRAAAQRPLLLPRSRRRRA